MRCIRRKGKGNNSVIIIGTHEVLSDVTIEAIKYKKAEGTNSSDSGIFVSVDIFDRCNKVAVIRIYKISTLRFRSCNDESDRVQPRFESPFRLYYRYPGAEFPSSR